jgi:hypothetical protein
MAAPNHTEEGWFPNNVLYPTLKGTLDLAEITLVLALQPDPASIERHLCLHKHCFILTKTENSPVPASTNTSGTAVTPTTTNTVMTKILLKVPPLVVELNDFVYR